MAVVVARLPSRRRRWRRRSPQLLALVRDALIDRCCSRGQIPAVRLHSRHSRLPRFPRSENISSCTALSVNQLMTSKKISSRYVLTGAIYIAVLSLLSEALISSPLASPTPRSWFIAANNVGNRT
jgi:hypothetical protein